MFYLLSKEPKVTSCEPSNFQLSSVRQDEHLGQGGWGPTFSFSILDERDKSFQVNCKVAGNSPIIFLLTLNHGSFHHHLVITRQELQHW